MHRKILNVAALNIPDTQTYTQQGVLLSLLDTDKPACKGTSKRDPLHAHLQHSSVPAKRNLPWTSWTAKRTSAAVMDFNSGNQGAPYWVPEIIRRNYEANNNSIFCHIAYSGLCACCLCFILRSKCLGWLQVGTTKHRGSPWQPKCCGWWYYQLMLARSLCTLHLLLRLATPSDPMEPQCHTHLMHMHSRM